MENRDPFSAMKADFNGKYEVLFENGRESLIDISRSPFDNWGKKTGLNSILVGSLAEEK